jgi:anti-anti-sigma factor
MNLKVTRQSDYVLAEVDGRIDTTNAGEFEKSMIDAMESGTGLLILDCAKLNYISSSGLRVFLVIQKKMSAAGRKFMLCSLQPAIREIFEISGFTYVFTIHDNVEACHN